MAVTHLPEPHPTDPVVAQLSRMYREAYDATLLELRRAAVLGLSTTFRQELLLRHGRRIAELRAFTLTWTHGPVDPATGARLLRESTLYRAIAAADRETVKQLAAIGIAVDIPVPGVITPSFALLNDYAIRVTAENIVQSLNTALTQFDTSVRGIIGRASNDVFRQAGLGAVGEKLTEGLTTRQARARLVNDLTDKGITAFTDTAGRDWNLKSYADMVIRTNTREATSEATLRRVENLGHDYLISTNHQPTCPVCAIRQGRVYCISGRDTRFPALRTVGNTPWHPNCGHSFVPYSPNYDSDIEATIALSNASWDVDPRSQAEIEGYNRSQKIKAEQRLKRQLTRQMQTPGLDPDTKDRLRLRRAHSNGRLIELNKAQRKQYKGWR